MKIFKTPVVLLLCAMFFIGCSKSKEESCDSNSTIILNGNAECGNGRVTFFKKNGEKGEMIGISFGNNVGKPFITVETSLRPIEVGIFQSYNQYSKEGSNFTRENQTFLKSVSVQITKMDREKKLISGEFSAEAEAGTYGGVHSVGKFSGTFTDIPF